MRLADAAQTHPISDVILVESDRDLAFALQQRVAAAATVIHGDCNDAAVIDRLRAALGYGTLGLAFVDNLGLDVPLETLRALTTDRKVDLCITFQVGDLKRNLRNALDGEDEVRWTAFFGEGWKPVARESERQNLTAGDTATRLLDFYGRQLTAIGYRHIAHSQRVMKNSRNVGLYRLILAGNTNEPWSSSKRLGGLIREVNVGSGRQLHPSAPIQYRVVSAALRRMATKLLQKECHAAGEALITQVTKPVGLRRSAAALTLAAGDQPMNAG